MKKDIIIVVGSLDVGGTEGHLLSVLPRLATKGWSVRVITTIRRGILAPEFEKKGVPVSCAINEKYSNWLQKLPSIACRLVRIVLSIFGLKSLLKRRDNNTNPNNSILHFYLPEPYVVGMVAASLAGFKGRKIMSRRCLNCYQQKAPLVGWLERKLHTKTSLITGNCQALVTQLHVEENVPLDHLRLIYNGIDSTLFTPKKTREEVRVTLAIKQDALIMVKVANLIPYKGHADLLVALSKIKDKLPKNWYLLCLGRDDGIGSALQQQAKDLMIAEHVLWLGSRPDISDLLFGSDMGILCPFKNEGFSNAILEGMTAGLPMIVTDIGGNKEAVVDNETGFVVEPRNTDKLATAILDLANNPNKSKKFGEAGRKRVKDYFSLDACVNAYESLYSSL